VESIDYLLNSEDIDENLLVVTAEIIDLNKDIAIIKTSSGEIGNLPITEFYPNRKWELNKKYILLRRESFGRVRYTVRDLNLIKLLLEGISPEIRDGRVRIIKIVREVGIRSKVAVASTVLDVNPIDSCVGPSAGRVRSLSKLLLGERVDFVAYSSDKDRYIKNTLGVEVEKIEHFGRRVEVVVPSHQYLSAVGGGGINSLICAKLLDLNLSILRSE
jgi:N utilization substance protein A